MPQDTRIAVFLLGKLDSALRANAPDLFKRRLSGGVQDLGESAITELFDWLDAFLTELEHGWRLARLLA